MEDEAEAEVVDEVDSVVVIEVEEVVVEVRYLHLLACVEPS